MPSARPWPCWGNSFVVPLITSSVLMRFSGFSDCSMQPSASAIDQRFSSKVVPGKQLTSHLHLSMLKDQPRRIDSRLLVVATEVPLPRRSPCLSLPLLTGAPQMCCFPTLLLQPTAIAAIPPSHFTSLPPSTITPTTLLLSSPPPLQSWRQLQRCLGCRCFAATAAVCSYSVIIFITSNGPMTMEEEEDKEKEEEEEEEDEKEEKGHPPLKFCSKFQCPEEDANPIQSGRQDNQMQWCHEVHKNGLACCSLSAYSEPAVITRSMPPSKFSTSI
jgi:hypothetical protein